MKKILIICCIVLSGCRDDASSTSTERVKREKASGLAFIQNVFRQKVDSLLPLAKQFVAANEYNREYLFIADLSIHSGVQRFAVVDLKHDSIIHEGLVAHGAGGQYFSAAARYSNTPNSLCSSPGRYKIGSKYNGRFGKAYKLHGLDKTNSKAYERFIVLHGYDCVPDSGTYPEYLCNSEGCPMVSYNFLDILSLYIDKSKNPLLLWIIG